MNRMTSDNTFEMNMTQRALNQVYVGKDGWAQYVEQPDREYSACDLIRTSAETLGVEMPILGDEALSDLLLDWLQYGTEEPEGILAILYRALYAMAALRAKLYRYEDTGLEPEQVMEQAAPKPNEPLSLAELREMNGEPVWCADLKKWGILEVDDIGFVVTFDHLVWCIEVEKLTLYRRKPEDADEN